MRFPDPGIDLPTTHAQTSFAAPLGMQMDDFMLRQRLAKTAQRVVRDNFLVERLSQRVYELLIADRRVRRERSGQYENWP